MASDDRLTTPRSGCTNVVWCGGHSTRPAYIKGEFMRIKFLVASSGAALLVLGGVSPAFAGEVTGQQKPVPAPTHAQSICSFSGQNNFNEPTEPGRTQSYGQIVAAGGKAFAPSPGVACNGHTGFFATGGGEG
jgi:hypothetical protein